MERTVLIIGAGIFGTSTAYHLSQQIPTSNITIVDQHPLPTPGAASEDPPYGASHDINKIVRSDYPDAYYMALAEEAIAAWGSWELIKPFYHRSGWIMMDKEGSDLAKRIRQSYHQRAGPDPTRDIGLDEVRFGWGGILKDVDAGGTQGAYHNASAGWAEADKAVAAMLDDTVRRGVKYCQGKLQELILGERGIEAVKMQDEQILRADKVLLATGAWTSEIMASIEDQLQFGENERLEAQVKAAGVCCAHYALSDEEFEKYRSAPVIIYGEDCEILPPPTSRYLKFSYPLSFSNPKKLASGREISAPWSKGQDAVPEKQKAEALAGIDRVMPQFGSSREVSYWRLCWDLVTPQQDQIIARHPHERLRNLYFAVGGSFHTWKFLPVIGKHVSNVVLDKGNSVEQEARWAWKTKGWREAGGGAHRKVVPTRTLDDMAGSQPALRST